MSRQWHRSIKWPPDHLGHKGERLFVDLLKRLDGLHYVVGFGTALGIHRDGRLIPTDSDLDINILTTKEQQVRDRLHGWPFALERSNTNYGTVQLVWYPEQVIVDVMLWRPSGAGYAYDKFTLGADGFNPEWRHTPYGWVPLPGGVEEHMADLFGDTWRIPQYRRKPA